MSLPTLAFPTLTNDTSLKVGKRSNFSNIKMWSAGSDFKRPRGCKSRLSQDMLKHEQHWKWMKCGNTELLRVTKKKWPTEMCVCEAACPDMYLGHLDIPLDRKASFFFLCNATFLRPVLWVFFILLALKSTGFQVSCTYPRNNLIQLSSSPQPVLTAVVPRGVFSLPLAALQPPNPSPSPSFCPSQSILHILISHTPGAPQS